MIDKNRLRKKRLQRNRYRISKKSNSSIRMSVFRSSKHIYVQIIDDSYSKTLFSASSIDPNLKLKKGSNKEAAFKVGEKIADLLKENSFQKEITFDKGSYKYHGRVKELAEGARSKGLKI